MRLELQALQGYLDQRHGCPVQICRVNELGGGGSGEAALKQFGYGAPLLVEYRVAEKKYQEVVHRIRRTPFGREWAADGAAAVWFDFRAFNTMPRHVPATDMLVYRRDGTLESLHNADELLLVTRYQPGKLYAADLIRLRDGGQLQPLDLARVEILATWLAEIHQTSHDDNALWRRRVRDLIGHGEGIMGLTDSYPTDFPLASAERLRAIEEAANRWRWRLKPLHHRLRKVHGDLHPFNIVFAADTDFAVLDRSRGEWGEPADDVSSLTINYIFFSLQRDGAFAGPFRTLYDRFWTTYLAHRPDDELVRVIQPWYAWRALVVASPVWYPTIADDVRRKLLAFGERVMEDDIYDYQHPEQYWQTQ